MSSKKRAPEITKIKVDQLNLPCMLTEDEFRDRSKSLGQELQNRDGLEAEKKAYVSQIAAKINESAAIISGLQAKINTGKEYRMVDCQVQIDWKAKEKQWVRLDTSEIAKTDIISDEDLQTRADIE